MHTGGAVTQPDAPLSVASSAPVLECAPYPLPTSVCYKSVLLWYLFCLVCDKKDCISLKKFSSISILTESNNAFPRVLLNSRFNNSILHVTLHVMHVLHVTGNASKGKVNVKSVVQCFCGWSYLGLRQFVCLQVVVVHIGQPVTSSRRSDRNTGGSRWHQHSQCVFTDGGTGYGS